MKTQFFPRISEKMSTSRRVYSEDGNFLIGDDFTTDRLRREARQLHLSKFSRIRREAHFARYRNSFLKCDLEETNNRIEQERKLKLAEMERARNAMLKQEKNRRKIRLESRDIIEKKTKVGPTSTTPGNENMGETEDEKNESTGFSFASLSPSCSSLVGGKRDSAGRCNTTTPTKPKIQVTSSSISNVEDFKRDLSGKQDKRLSVAASSSSRASSVAEKCNLSGEQTKRLSVEALSSPRVPFVAGKQDKTLSITASSSSRAPSVAGKQDKKLNVAALSSSRSPSVAGKQYKRLCVADLSRSSSRALSVARKRGKTLGIAALNSSRASSVVEKRDKTLGAAARSSSRASSVAGKRDVAGKQRQMTTKTPSVQITPSNDLGSGNRNSFENNFVVVEQAAQRENLIEGGRSAKSSKDFGQSRIEKTIETDPDNEFSEGTKDHNSRMHSALVSEAGSEASSRRSGSRISRVNGGSISPALTEIQETNTKKAQTQSAHERWMWTEFDKIMKGFAEVLQIEHKSVNLKNSKNAVPEKDSKPLNTPRNPMTPLYFRYGISDRIVFRC